MRHFAAIAAMSVGLLASTACASRGYMMAMGPPPPPPPRAYYGVAPGPRYVWTDGFWAWRGRWVWAPGRWAIPPHPRAVWVPGYWVPRHRGYVFIEGRWR